MGLSARVHELVSIVSLGLGTLFVMMGYDTQAFIVESVLHSVNHRDPEKIHAHAGYYGSSVLYASYTVSNLIVPWICFRIGSKWTLFSGSVLFTMYLLGFFFLNPVYYYASQILMGLGFALYYVGQGMYMSEHSSRGTISRNSVLISAIGNSSMLAGGIVLALIFTINGTSFKSMSPPTNTNGTIDLLGEEDLRPFRDFPNQEIFVIYGVLFVCSLISNGIFASLPVKQYDSLSQKDPTRATSIWSQLGMMCSTMSEGRLLMLVPFFLFYGLHVSFWLSTYPTSFAFSSSLASNPLLPAYYSAMVGLGNIVVGVYIHVMSSRNSSFGLVPTMKTQLVLSLIMYGLTVASTPNGATVAPTNEPALWIQPTTSICLLMGLLHGMIDCCSCTMRTFVCTIVLPNNRLQAYSVGKLYQSLATCAGSFLAPHLTVYTWVGMLAVLQLLSATGFCTVSKQIEADERRKIHDLPENLPMGDAEKRNMGTEQKL